MAKEVAFKVTVDTSKSTESVDKTTDSVDKLGKKTKKTSSEMKGGFESAGASASQLGSKMGGATGAAISFATGIKSMTKAALVFIATPLGLLLAGIALAVVAVKSAFNDSEEGQNKYAKLMAVIGVVLGNLKDLLSDFGESIIAVFEDPQKALSDFGDSIKKNIEVRIEGMLELIPALGKAISLAFSGEFKEAGKVAVNAMGKAGLGIESVTDEINKATEAVKDFGEQTEKEMKQAAGVADMRAKADKIARALLVERAEKEGEIAELRLRARQEDQFGAEERREAIIKATELQDGLLQKETEVLQLRADAQILENTFSRSNKENLDKEAEAIAKVSRQQAVRLNQARTMQRELNTINTQLSAEEKARITEDEKIQAEADKKELELLKQLAEAKNDLILEEEERLIGKAELDLENRLAKIQGDSEIELELRKSLEEVTGIEIQAIKDKFTAEENKKKKNSDKKELDAAQDIANAKISLASSVGNILGSIGSMISKESEAGVIASKTLAVAQIAINTAMSIVSAIAGATSAAAATGPGAVIATPIFIASQIATVLAGVGQATAILNGAGGGGPTAATPSVTAPTASAAPSFAGVTTNTTELGNTEAANLAPIQAFVVETGITGSQNNVNQIEGQATFGNPE